MRSPMRGKMRKIKFSTRIPGGDRRHYLTEEDVIVVLGRLPEEAWTRLRAVHFNDRGCNRHLGYVNVGHREITICALPPRMSLSGALVKGQSCEQFGAIRG